MFHAVGMMTVVVFGAQRKRATEVESLDQSRDFGRITTIGQAHIQYAWRFLASSAPLAVNQGNYLHRRERQEREDRAQRDVVFF